MSLSAAEFSSATEFLVLSSEIRQPKKAIGRRRADHRLQSSSWLPNSWFGARMIQQARNPLSSEALSAGGNRQPRDSPGASDASLNTCTIGVRWYRLGQDDYLEMPE